MNSSWSKQAYKICCSAFPGVSNLEGDTFRLLGERVPVTRFGKVEIGRGGDDGYVIVEDTG